MRDTSLLTPQYRVGRPGSRGADRMAFRRKTGRRQSSSPAVLSWLARRPLLQGTTRSRAGIATLTLATGESVEIMVKMNPSSLCHLSFG